GGAELLLRTLQDLDPAVCSHAPQPQLQPPVTHSAEVAMTITLHTALIHLEHQKSCIRCLLITAQLGVSMDSPQESVLSSLYNLYTSHCRPAHSSNIILTFANSLQLILHREHPYPLCLGVVLPPHRRRLQKVVKMAQKVAPSPL
ncbi:hypothetical protein GOODEAATRI_001819, partial [Goodea atripinnis]